MFMRLVRVPQQTYKQKLSYIGRGVSEQAEWPTIIDFLYYDTHKYAERETKTIQTKNLDQMRKK